MESTKVFVDKVDIFLSRIPPWADVSHRVPTTKSREGFWDVVSGLGRYNPDALEDATVITKKNNTAYFDMIVTLGDQEPDLLLTKDAQHIWKSMKTRYQQPSLVEWCDLLKE
ncbi:hypothetical protein V1524DRAFT_450113 [Lipomyces starkeyi]